MTYLTGKRIEWHTNKISGGIAEAACRAHFEALGYSVENFGIEHIARQYCAARDSASPLGTYGAKFDKTLQKMPDFLVSRRHPDTPSVAKIGVVDHLDAFLVDAKYRKCVHLDSFNAEMIATYDEIHKRDIDFFIYLVTKKLHYNRDTEYTKTVKVDGQKVTAYVHIGYFPGISSGKAPEWMSVGERKLTEDAIYLGMTEGDGFTSVYSQIIHHALDVFLSSDGKA